MAASTPSLPEEAEKRFGQPAARPRTQFLRQFAGKIRNVRLNHRRATAFQFALQCLHHRRMIVTDIVNAVSRKKIEDAPSILGEQFHSQAALITDIHLQQIKKPHPFRVYPLGIALRGLCSLFDLESSSHSLLEMEFTGVTAIEVGAPGNV